MSKKKEELAEAIKGIEAELASLKAQNRILRQENHNLLEQVEVLMKIIEVEVSMKIIEGAR